MTKKKQIYNLFKSGKTLYFSDISDILNMNLKEVVKICKQLYREKKIFVQKDK